MMKMMKKAVFCAAAACLSLAACASKPASQQPPVSQTTGTLPGFVQQWVREAPEDVLYGIGSAKHGTESLSKQTATQRARVEIAQQMNITVQAMVQDYSAGSEEDTSAVLQFSEVVSRSITEADLSGSKVWGYDKAADGTVYVMVTYNVADAVKLMQDQVDQAAALAKLAPAAAANFAAQDKLDQYLGNTKSSRSLTIRDSD